jgi:hypothetical protein
LELFSCPVCWFVQVLWIDGDSSLCEYKISKLDVEQLLDGELEEEHAEEVIEAILKSPEHHAYLRRIISQKAAIKASWLEH